MEQAYNNSILMIKNLNKTITAKEYNELAKQFNLLSSESLKYISGMKFKTLIKKILKGCPKVQT